jgi:hypothetical protein
MATDLTDKADFYPYIPWQSVANPLSQTYPNLGIGK